MSKTEPAPEETNEAELDRTVDEMRDALREETKTPRGGHADFVMGIPVELQIVLGSAEMPVSELMALQKGSTVSLDRRIGEPVDIVVNGRRVARGEITLLEDDQSRFGVRLTEIGGATDK